MMSILLALLVPIAFKPCAVLPEYRERVDVRGIEFCEELNTAYEAAEKGDWGEAYLAASAADNIWQYEYETYEALLPMAEAACKSDRRSLGKKHLKTFQCMFDAELDRIPRKEGPAFLMSPRDSLSAVHETFGYKLDSPRCASYLVDHFPGPFEFITDAEERILKDDIEKITAVCSQVTE